MISNGNRGARLWIRVLEQLSSGRFTPQVSQSRGRRLNKPAPKSMLVPRSVRVEGSGTG